MAFRRTATVGAAVMLAFSGAAHANDTTVSVFGTSNPSLAGYPNGTTCCSGDSAPAQSPVLALTGFATGTPITFSTVGGFLNFPGSPNPTTDGSGLFSMTTYTSLSAPAGVLVNGLVGVFLTDAVPSGAAPASRNDGLSFLSISPQLNQIFWIGDGLTGTGSGTVQTFYAPTGATRLFLGTADGFGWFNNVGTARVTIHFEPDVTGVPEPTSWALMIGGLGLAGAALRRRRAQVNPAGRQRGMIA